MISQDKLNDMQMAADTCRTMILQFLGTPESRDAQADPGAMMAWMMFKKAFTDLIEITEEYRVLAEENQSLRAAVGGLPNGLNILTLLGHGSDNAQ